MWLLEVCVLSSIKEVIAKDNYCLEIFLENGNRVTLNLESRLHTLRFGMLAKKEFFKQVTTDGNYLRWGNRLELSISEIFQLAQR